MTKDTIDIFVYGTLKVGGHFARRFNEVRENSVTGRISGTLFNISKGFFPGITLGGENEVVGELHTYSKPEEVIGLMDQIEGHPRLFKRGQVSVKLDDGEVKEAAVYAFNQPTDGSEVIESGVWEIKKEED